MPPGVTGWITEDPSRLHALVAHPGTGQVLEALHPHTLHRKDGALGFRPAATVVADLPIHPHHSMTRDEVRDRIVGERGPHRPHRRRSPDLPRDPAVGAHLAAR